MMYGAIEVVLLRAFLSISFRPQLSIMLSRVPIDQRAHAQCSRTLSTGSAIGNGHISNLRSHQKMQDQRRWAPHAYLHSQPLLGLLCSWSTVKNSETSRITPHMCVYIHIKQTNILLQQEQAFAVSVVVRPSCWSCLGSKARRHQLTWTCEALMCWYKLHLDFHTLWPTNRKTTGPKEVLRLFEPRDSITKLNNFTKCYNGRVLIQCIWMHNKWTSRDQEQYLRLAISSAASSSTAPSASFSCANCSVWKSSHSVSCEPTSTMPHDDINCTAVSDCFACRPTQEDCCWPYP